MKEELFLIQDTRTTCGNSVFWWCWHGQGYTLDVRCAGVYTKTEAEKICQNRDTDKMWPLHQVLKLVQHHVDMQDLHRADERTVSHIFSHIEPRS